jgi:D-arabinose 1-dehydrogenase-like Zn-dependent alcohol dehydrogenase
MALPSTDFTQPEKTMATMRVAQISKAGGKFELVERPIPEPGPGTIRIKVQACGICHSDALTVEGTYPCKARFRVVLSME